LEIQFCVKTDFTKQKHTVAKMGGCQSGSADNKATEDKRMAQRTKREQWQAQRRPKENDPQADLQKQFEATLSKWPAFSPWGLKGRNTQGVTFRVIEPPNMRDQSFTVVQRNNFQYMIRVGFGPATGFNAAESHMAFNVPQVSKKHSKLHFKRMSDRSTMFIEDELSLNGTFVLARAYPGGPMLEKEVKDMCNLANVEFVRFGQNLVVALECTTIFWDGENDDEAPLTERSNEKPPEQVLSELLDDGWYFPKDPQKS
jgi:hypothetical protein